MKYQFQIDGRAFNNPVRDTWEEAADDAVCAGYATRNGGINGDDITLTAQGEIARIPDPEKPKS